MTQRGVEDLAAGPPEPRQPQQRPDRERLCRGTGRAAGGPGLLLGEYYDKPTIGDPLREIEPRDILRANRMMYAESLLGPCAWGWPLRLMLVL